MKALTMEQMVGIEGGGCQAAVWRAVGSLGVRMAAIIAAAAFSGPAGWGILAAILAANATLALTIWGLVDACSS